MIFCIPTTSKSDNALLSDHFGSSPYYAFYNSESKSLDFVENKGHHHGSCSPAETVLSKEGQAALLKGLGKNAYRKFSDLGIKIYITDSIDLGEAIAQIDSGNLSELNFSDACGGGGGCH